MFRSIPWPPLFAISFALTRLPVPADEYVWTPSPPLLRMRLGSPDPSPPMTLPLPLAITMPSNWFGSDAPPAVVPIELPKTWLFELPIARPMLLPEMTLPAVAVVPPMTFPDPEPLVWIPKPVLASAAVPAPLVPMRFPWTVTLLPKRSTPSPELPEMTLPRMTLFAPASLPT